MHATNFDYEKIGNSAEKEFPIRTTSFLEKLETHRGGFPTRVFSVSP
jgi:hypothetical protein